MSIRFNLFQDHFIVRATVWVKLTMSCFLKVTYRAHNLEHIYIIPIIANIHRTQRTLYPTD